MPNYDIVPLATDLLEYTIQRVRAKEPEYRRVRVYVMETGICDGKRAACRKAALRKDQG